MTTINKIYITSTLREVKCTFTKKDLSLELNTAILEAFWISASLKTEWEFPYTRTSVGKWKLIYLCDIWDFKVSDTNL